MLEKLNRGGDDTSFFEGTVKLDPASEQAWKLVDYGQFAHGRCRGYMRTPVLRRDEFLNKVCKALYVDGTSCVVCQANCCAMTSTLVGLLEANVFSEQELLSMLVKAASAGRVVNHDSTERPAKPSGPLVTGRHPGRENKQ